MLRPLEVLNDNEHVQTVYSVHFTTSLYDFYTWVYLQKKKNPAILVLVCFYLLKHRHKCLKYRDDLRGSVQRRVCGLSVSCSVCLCACLNRWDFKEPVHIIVYVSS